MGCIKGQRKSFALVEKRTFPIQTLAWIFFCACRTRSLRGACVAITLPERLFYRHPPPPFSFLDKRQNLQVSSQTKCLRFCLPGKFFFFRYFLNFFSPVVGGSRVPPLIIRTSQNKPVSCKALLVPKKCCEISLAGECLCLQSKIGTSIEQSPWRRGAVCGLCSYCGVVLSKQQVLGGGGEETYAVCLALPPHTHTPTCVSQGTSHLKTNHACRWSGHWSRSRAFWCPISGCVQAPTA